MAHITADRVRETSTTTGTGAFTLAGAVQGFRAFSTVLAVNDTCYYTIADLPGTNWEVGIGTYSAASTLTRTTVLSSSNAGAAVTFGAGTKDVFITAAAGRFLQADSAGSYGNFSAGTITASLTGTVSTPNGASGIFVGDDVILADRNVANTLFVSGNQNSDRGYINFSTSATNSLGAIAGGALTWNGNTIWHAGNDGTGSGLDADLLDGLNSSSANTVSTIVARDASGNFSAGTITATLSGNASTVTNGLYTTTNFGGDVSGTYNAIVVADNSHNHTSLTGVTSIGFASEASDTASLSTTINGTGTYFDFNLTDDLNNDWWRWRFTPSGGTVYDAMTLKPSASGVANLVVAGSVTGTTLVSNVATGTAPLTVTSSTSVTNLNADLLDGNHASAFATVGQTTYVGTTAIALNRTSATQSLTGITSIDGSAATVVQTTDPVATTYRLLLGNGTNAAGTVYNKSALYWNDTGSIIQGANISGNAATATTIQTARTINGSSFNGSANIDTTEWIHSGRDFVNGTLITTTIDYSVANGDPFILQIRGNSYGSSIPFDIQLQGYIYNSTIINYGGYSTGPRFDIIAMNVGGKLCFWFARQTYWQGFNVHAYSAYATRPTNRVESITDVVNPNGTKQVTYTPSQVLRSDNYNSYSPTLTGTGASGTWGINVTGNAATVTNGVYTTGDQTIGGNKTFSSPIIASAGLYGAGSGAPDVLIWGVSTANPTWGIFYNEGTPDLIEFKAAGVVKSSISLDDGVYSLSKVNASSTGLASSFGGTLATPNATVATQTSYIQLLAGTGAATNSAGLIFHNPTVSTSALEYVNTDANTGYFNFKSDDTTWNLRVAGNTVWHAGNDGSTSGLDADLLDGYNSAQASTVSTVAVRDGSGDINVRLIRQEYTDQATISGGMVFRVNNSSDNYLRVCNSVSAIKTYLGTVDRDEVKSFGTIAVQAVAGSSVTCTTVQFITWLETQGFFDYVHSYAKCSWDYAGNNDISDTGFGTNFELAGCVIETWTDNSDDTVRGNITVRITAPTTGGTAGSKILVYNDQGAGYSPGWRQIWNSTTLTNLNQLTNGPGYVTSSGVTSVATSGGYGGLTLTGGTITTTGTITLGGTPTGTWPISTSGNSATTSMLQGSGTITYGASGTQWLNQSGTGGAGTNGAAPSNPTNDWYHHLIMNHANGGGYYVDFAACFHSDTYAFRRMVNGVDQGWKTLWHSGNLTNLNQLTNGPGYTNNVGTVTSVGGTGTVSGLTLSGSVTTSGNLTLGGTLSLTSGNVTTALGYTPYNSTNPNGYITAESDTLATVTGRGASTSTHTTFGPYAGSATTGNTTSIEIVNNGGTGDSDVAAMAFHCSGTYATHMHLRNDGYFGVGGWSASSWRWYVALATGNMTAAGSVTAYSDVRLKEEITPLENSLDKILSLNGVRFRWKNLPDIVGAPGKLDFGVLAHEVERVAPEVISGSPHTSPDGDPYKTVAYDKLVPLLIEAIKDQQKIIDSQEERIKRLEEIVQKLAN